MSVIGDRLSLAAIEHEAIELVEAAIDALPADARAHLEQRAASVANGELLSLVHGLIASEKADEADEPEANAETVDKRSGEERVAPGSGGAASDSGPVTR